MRTLYSVLALLAALAAPASAEIAGPARAIDGDTLDVGRSTLRLHGVDAPEAGQTCGADAGADWDCGAAATARLAELVAAGDLRCAALERDAYGRVVAICSAGGLDVGATLVTEGLAWADPRYGDAYAAAEAAARAARRGVWQGAATAAWEWRRTEGFRPAAGAAPPTAAPEGCAIKGNVNAGGERIYHTPLSRDYAGTRVDEARGERWFCDAAAARSAGWRAPR